MEIRIQVNVNEAETGAVQSQDGRVSIEILGINDECRDYVQKKYKGLKIVDGKGNNDGSGRMERGSGGGGVRSC